MSTENLEAMNGIFNPSKTVRGEETEGPGDKKYEDNPDTDGLTELEIVPENKKSSVTFLGMIGYPRPGTSNHSERSIGDGYGHHSPTRSDEKEDDTPPSQPHAGFIDNRNGIKVSRSYQLDDTEHYIKGKGILASKRDVRVAPDEFAEGCKLLQAAALGETKDVKKRLTSVPDHINFRDYDRRTALHVAASEGHLDVVRLLVEQFNAPIHRSDRWGGSPLDDAHRHRHTEVVRYLRSKGASTGSMDQTTNLITAAAAGDLEEVKMIVGENESGFVETQPENLSTKRFPCSILLVSKLPLMEHLLQEVE